MMNERCRRTKSIFGFRDLHGLWAVSAFLERIVGEELYIQFDMGAFYHGLQERGVPEDGYARAASVVAEHLPAVCQFLPDSHTSEVAAAAGAAGAEWGQPIYMNYDNPRTNWTFGGPGTETLRRNWADARFFDSTLLQLTTWNDYHENTNISPGTNNNYAYFDLTGYLIDWWKTGRQPEPGRDRVYVFSRKYPHGAPIFPFQSIGNAEGKIEIVTILPEPSRVRVPGRGEYDAPAGFSFRQFPLMPGPVSAGLIREGAVEVSVDLPEPVTDKPFRQDNGITGISTECEAHWRADFDDTPRELYIEYGEINGDRLPNWFEMYWFGHFGDKSTATSATPREDINGDGYTNYETCLIQRDPVTPPATTPFHGTPIALPGRIEVEDFDLGGEDVAYNDATALNEGKAYRSDEAVGLEPTDDVGGGYNLGWTAPGEWLLFTVDVEEAGLYDLVARVASPEENTRFQLELEGGNPVRIEVPNTGGLQEWINVEVRNVALEQGEQTMRLYALTGGFNTNFVELSSRAVFFEDWLKVHFTAEEIQEASISGEMTDANGNGIPNLMEYALNRDPRAAGREGLPDLESTLIEGKKYLTLTYSRPAGVQDLQYRVEVSENFVDWQSGSDHFRLMSVTRKGDEEVVVVRNVEPIEALTRRLIRLRVERVVNESSKNLEQ